MSGTVTIERDDILDLISCSEDYGFADDVLLCSLFSWLGPVSDDEIAEFAAEFLTPEMRAMGYGEEDRDAAVERLTRLRDQYGSAT